MSDLSTKDTDRGLERHFISCDLEVYDRIRNLYLGRLVNIHASGLMIVGDVPLEEDKLYEMDIHLPQHNHSLRIGVDCLWVRPADRDGKHWTGFSIIDASPAATEEIRKLIESWSLS